LPILGLTCGCMPPASLSQPFPKYMGTVALREGSPAPASPGEAGGRAETPAVGHSFLVSPQPPTTVFTPLHAKLITASLGGRGDRCVRTDGIKAVGVEPRKSDALPLQVYERLFRSKLTCCGKLPAPSGTFP
jgi:hypothetical protein